MIRKSKSAQRRRAKFTKGNARNHIRGETIKLIDSCLNYLKKVNVPQIKIHKRKCEESQEKLSNLET